MLEQRLAGRDWIMGDAYTIADMATFPWVNNLITFYEAGELVGIADYPNVTRVLARVPRAPGRRQGARHPEAGQGRLSLRECWPP